MKGPQPQSHVTLQYRSHVTNKKVIFPLSQGLQTSNLAGWKLRMRGPHLQSHVTHPSRGHVTNQKRYIFTFTRPMDPNLNRVMSQDEGNPRAKSSDTSIVQSCDKSKIFCLHFHKAQGAQTQQAGDQNEKTPPNISYHVTTIQQVVYICYTSS